MTGAKVGYKRVSTLDQRTDRQLEGLALDRIFEEFASGKDTNRPQLQELLKFLREGDTLFVHAIDRLARNLDDLRRLVKLLTDRGVTVEFLTERLTFPPNGVSPVSQMMLTLLGCLAEFERGLFLERQREGITLAQRAGRYKGSKLKLSPAARTDLVRRATEPGVNRAAIAREFQISYDTLHRYLKRAEAANGTEKMGPSGAAC